MLTKGLRVVALISGGKDSCYNMIQCVSEGHSIAALANLRPKDKDEVDSYMFQTVGHHLIDLYSQALGVPLYRRTLEGSSVDQRADYTITKEDEVEDLYELLKEVKEKENVNAVSVGAILSDYQRVRVENVCLRLGLTPLAYLWRRDQKELMAEMVAAGVEAIIIKVAALGLNPHKHLGRSLAQIYPHMLTMESKYGLNVCGEGGEYETFTLDCPLFNKRIVVDKQELVMHSDDPISPVGYLNLLEAHLEEKETIGQTSGLDQLPIYRSSDLMNDLFPDGPPGETDLGQILSCPGAQIVDQLTSPPDSYVHTHSEASGHFWITGVMGWIIEGQSIDDMTSKAMSTLSDHLGSLGMTFKDLVIMHMYVSNMKDFAEINRVYKEYFTLNPPARLCIEVTLPENVGLRLACYGYKPPDGDAEPLSRRTMHVQGLSHWAPANIGPYSQAVKLDETVYVAGQIGMVAASLDLVPGLAAQCRLSLRHVARVLSALCPAARLHHLLVGVCYLTHPNHIATATTEYEAALQMSLDHEEMDPIVEDRSAPIMHYVIVPALPKGALVEWQVYTATCDDVISGKVTKRTELLESTLHYTYLPQPYNLLSYSLTVDSPNESARDIKTYQSAVKLAYDTLSAARDRLLEKSTVEQPVLSRCIQIYYTRGTVNEDQLRKHFESLPSSPFAMPVPAFIPVESLTCDTRVITLCS